LALGVGMLATRTGLGRERGFYPTLTIVIASYYVLFATAGASIGMMAAECVGLALFTAAAIGALRGTLWLAVAALAAHGLFDLVHPHLIANPGVPAWWPPFCLAYDVAAAGYLALLLVRGTLPARAGR
jgi:hypothetical protein